MKGISTGPDKVGVIRDWTAPTNVKSLQSFLGFCNFYRKFVPCYSGIAKPLTELTRKDQPWVWGKAQQQAFDELQRLTEAPTLEHFDHSRETRVETDASN